MNWAIFKNWLATNMGVLTVAIVTSGAISGAAITGTSLKSSGLTSGRVVVASTAGLLADDSDLTFATDTLSATKIASSTLTATRVPVAGAAGLLLDDSGMTYVVATDTLSVGALTVTADVAAAGGFRTVVGSFTAPGAAGVTAGSQTNLDMRYSFDAAAAASSFVATRAGSIMGISGQLNTAITTAGGPLTLVISVTKNGTEVACTATFTTGGAEVVAYGVVAKDTLTFVAGDVIGVSYTSGAISNTPTLVASVEIEE